MPSLQVSNTDIMTHLSNAAKSFQKLLQIVMSQAPLTEINVTATSTQLETDDARNQRSKGKKNKKKKNKRKGRNGKNYKMDLWYDKPKDDEISIPQV